MSQFRGEAPAFDRAIEPAITGLTATAGLSPKDADHLRSMSLDYEDYPPGTPMVCAGPEPRMKLILSGWACELRLLPYRRRQIFEFYLPGDVVLSRPGNETAPCTLVALTRVGCIDLTAVADSACNSSHPSLAATIATALSLGEQRKYDQILRLGQHTAYERTVHLLLELRDRLAIIDMTVGQYFRLPLTQDHLADTLGLSVVHVNRTLKKLRTQGLLIAKSGGITLLQPQTLALLAGRVFGSA